MIGPVVSLSVFSYFRFQIPTNTPKNFTGNKMRPKTPVINVMPKTPVINNVMQLFYIYLHAHQRDELRGQQPVRALNAGRDR